MAAFLRNKHFFFDSSEGFALLFRPLCSIAQHVFASLDLVDKLGYLAVRIAHIVHSLNN